MVGRRKNGGDVDEVVGGGEDAGQGGDVGVVGLFGEGEVGAIAGLGGGVAVVGVLGEGETREEGEPGDEGGERQLHFDVAGRRMLGEVKSVCHEVFQIAGSGQ